MSAICRNKIDLREMMDDKVPERLVPVDGVLM